MIKTFLIYKVLDRCIDVLFNRIDANLCLPDDKLKPGTRFKELVTVRLAFDDDDVMCTAHYFNAVILENDGFVIKFKFEWYSVLLENVEASDENIERMRDVRTLEPDPNLADMQVARISDSSLMVIKAYSVPMEDFIEVIHIDYDRSKRDLG